MAEIQVERKPQSRTGLVVAMLLLVAVLGAGWYFMMGPGAVPVGVDDGPDIQQPAPGSSPYSLPPPTPPGPTAGPEMAPQDGP